MKYKSTALWLNILCLLAAAPAALAQDAAYIRVDEEKNLTYGGDVGGVHFFSGEILEIVSDDDAGKVVQWADSTLLVPYGKANNKKVSYTKISETEPEKTASMLEEYDQVRSGIMQSLTLTGGEGGMLVMDLAGLDESLGKVIRVDISNNAAAKLSAEKSRQVERGIENFTFPLRIVPSGYPTFWVTKEELQSGAVTPAATAEQTPEQQPESVQEQQPAEVVETEEPVESNLMEWLPWLLFGLALLLAAFFAYPFFSGKNKSNEEALLRNQRDMLEILRNLNGAGAAAAVAATTSRKDKPVAENASGELQQKIAQLEQQEKAARKELETTKQQHSELQADFEAMREESATKISAAAASLSQLRQKALFFKEDEAASFAENHQKVINESLKAYDELTALTLQAAANEATAAEASVLAAILSKDNVGEKVNKLRQYSVDLNRLGETGVWTRQEEVQKLKGQENAEERVGLIRRNLVTQILAPYLNQLLIMLEEAGHLHKITGRESGVTERAAELADRGQGLRKLAQQLIALNIDHVPLFANMNDYSKIGAVRKTPAAYLMGVELPSHHIRQVVEYGMTYGDIDKKTEVILQE